MRNVTRKCDECNDEVWMTGPGYQLCRRHWDKKDRADRAHGDKRTKKEGIIVQTCPRRYELFQRGGAEGQDTWRFSRLNNYRTCSYCGCAHPDYFMEQVRAGFPIEATDKSYKVYMDDHAKFYFQHLSDEQMTEFVRLFNEHVIKTTRYVFGGPVDMTSEVVDARSYWNGALPFFMRRGAPPEDPTDE